MDDSSPRKATRMMIDDVLDVDGFLIDLKTSLGGEREVQRVAESYSMASVETIKRLLYKIPKEDIDWN